AVETDLYDLLGVSASASPDEIKKAYKKKARENHPDKNINDPDAHEKFQAIASASGMGGGGVDPNDLFAQFFGGGFGFGFGPGARRSRGDDSTETLDVTLEDLYNGKTIKLAMERDVICSGLQRAGPQSTQSPRQVARTQCRDCKGAGERLKEKDRCKKCKGDKVVKEKARQELHIEKGMHDKQRIVLTGAGDQEPGLPAGDIIFVLKAEKHESFQRMTNDLITPVKITLSEALFGFSRVIVTHLDALQGKIIKPNDSIIVRGEGMPVEKRPDTKGDLHVVFSIEMPDEQWLKTVDAAYRPPPAIVDEADYEESDVAEFQSTWLEQELQNEFEDDWEDEDDDEAWMHLSSTVFALIEVETLQDNVFNVSPRLPLGASIMPNAPDD
ncbi:hypothetical protein BKA70DRAFT_1277267, partial [Coprinopsis sp. MPI-PUGE-AT-0042]